MMPTIRVEDDVFEGLQRLAKPFVDSPSIVIRRLLEEKGVLTTKASPSIDSVKSQSTKNVASAANLTPQPVYEQFLLFVLSKGEFNGKAHKRDVTHAVIKRMMKDGFVGAADQELVATGETKAENTIAWARNALKDRGYISRLSPRGIWELTPEGQEAAGKLVLPKPRQT
jgi:predicted CopG family antitoxin